MFSVRECHSLWCGLWAFLLCRPFARRKYLHNTIQERENIFFADICSTLIEYWFICIYISTALFRRFDRGLVRWPPFNMRERDRERERERESSISLRAQKSFTFYLIWWIFPEKWPVCRQNGEMFTISEFTWHSRRLNYCVSLTMIRFLRCMYTH